MVGSGAGIKTGSVTGSGNGTGTKQATEKELELGIGIGIIAYGTEKQKSCAETKCKRKPKNPAKGPADNLQSALITALCTEKQLWAVSMHRKFDMGQSLVKYAK